MFLVEGINLPPVIDFEASSLHPAYSYPISVGLVVGGQSYYWEICPKTEWTDWSDKSEKIHGLTRQHLLLNGLDPTWVCRKVQSLLMNYTAIYSDEPLWERLWAKRLGLKGLSIRDVRALLLPGKESELHGKVDHFMRERGLTVHYAEHDAIAITLAANCLMS